MCVCVYVYINPSKYAVVEDSKEYLKNQTNGYVSKYLVNVFGCFGFSSNTHICKDCDDHRLSEVRSVC